MAKKSAAPGVAALGFTGMNNLKKAPGYFMDPESRRITPALLLNADVHEDGTVEKRGGRRLLIPLTQAHSLWGNSWVKLCVAGAAPGLYRLEGTSAVEICKVSGPSRARMEYLEIGDEVYLSNGHWNGVLSLLDWTIRSWGFPLPLAPDAELVEGDLPPGVYKLTYTHTDGKRLGGNGDLLEIQWEGETRGIHLVNQPEDCIAWITQANGKEFFRAPVDNGVISHPHYTQPLTTFGVAAPPPLTAMCFAHGRVWGANGPYLLYSDEFQADHFRDGNVIPFEEPLTLVAPVNKGLFVNSLRRTWLLEGTVPGKMGRSLVGEGAIPGTLTMALVEGSGYEISRKFSHTPSPLWASRTGVMVGTQTGHLVHLTETRLKINPYSKGASVYRVRQGRPQAIVSLFGAPLGEHDPELTEIFKRGRIFVPPPVDHRAYGGVLAGGSLEIGFA